MKGEWFFANLYNYYFSIKLFFMRKLFFILFCAIIFKGYSTDKMYSLIIAYTFGNIEQGYDHTNKIIVYVDGNRVTESVPEVESVANAVRILLKSGTHKVKVENWVLYKGKWE